MHAGRENGTATHAVAVPASATACGGAGTFDRGELIRVLLQALEDLGLAGAAEALQRETGVPV